MSKGICVGGPYHGWRVTCHIYDSGHVEIAARHGMVCHKFEKVVDGIFVFALPGVSDAAIADAIRSLKEK